MKRTLIAPQLDLIPDRYHPLLKNAAIYDSRCASGAQVLYIEKDDGYFLKSDIRGNLERERAIASFFASEGLAPPVLDFFCTETHDYMLTRKARGEDATDERYLNDPARLCDKLALILRTLHSMDISKCAVSNHTEHYIKTATQNYLCGNYDKSLFPDNWGYESAEQAWNVVDSSKHLLRTDTLLHGDYCLPNVILDNWNFSAFIDLGNGGIGDRHVDLFWGRWTLFFNLGTDKYGERFLDAYGRDAVDNDMLDVIAAFEVFG